MVYELYGILLSGAVVGLIITGILAEWGMK